MAGCSSAIGPVSAGFDPTKDSAFITVTKLSTLSISTGHFKIGFEDHLLLPYSLCWMKPIDILSESDRAVILGRMLRALEWDGHSCPIVNSTRITGFYWEVIHRFLASLPINALAYLELLFSPTRRKHPWVAALSLTIYRSQMTPCRYSRACSVCRCIGSRSANGSRPIGATRRAGRRRSSIGSRRKAASSRLPKRETWDRLSRAVAHILQTAQ